MPEPLEVKLSEESQYLLDFTLQKMMPVWMSNFAKNLHEIRYGKNAGDIIKPLKQPAIIVGAGPSIYKNNHLEALAKSNFKGLIFSTDRMLKPCIDCGIEPTYACSVDGDIKIADFYKKLPTKIKTKILLCATTINPLVVQTISEQNLDIYWFLSMLDNPYKSMVSLTRAMHYMTDGKFILQTPAQVGATLWNIALCFTCTPIILLGFDFSYSDLNPKSSLYYNHFLELCKGDEEKVKSFYKIGENPHFKNIHLVDGIWLMYKELFMLLINSAPCETINCTGGGSLWGGKIKSMTLEEALRIYV